MTWKTASNLLIVVALVGMCLLGSLPRQSGSRLPILPGALGRGMDMSGGFAGDRPISTNASVREQRQQDAIRAAAFQYQFSHCALSPGRETGKSRVGRTYFLSVCGDQTRRGLDPDPALILRLSHAGYHVQPASRATSEPSADVHARVGGAPGISVSQTAIRWITPAEVEMDGGCYHSRDQQSGGAYHLVRMGKAWVVVESVAWS